MPFDPESLVEEAMAAEQSAPGSDLAAPPPTSGDATETHAQDAADSGESLFQDQPGDHPDVIRQKKELRAAMSRIIAKRDQEKQQLTREVESLKGMKNEAEAFRKLINNPKALDLAKQVAESNGGQPQGPSLGITAKALIPHIRPDVAQKFQPEHLEAFSELALNILDNTVARQMQGPLQMLQQLWQERQGSEESQLVQKYPGAEKFLPDAKQLAQATGLSLEEALFAKAKGSLRPSANGNGNGQAHQPEPKPTQQRPDLRSVPRDQMARAIQDGAVDKDALAAELVALYRQQEGGNGGSFGAFFR